MNDDKQICLTIKNLTIPFAIPGCWFLWLWSVHSSLLHRLFWRMRFFVGMLEGGWTSTRNCFGCRPVRSSFQPKLRRSSALLECYGLIGCFVLLWRVDGCWLVLGFVCGWLARASGLVRASGLARAFELVCVPCATLALMLVVQHAWVRVRSAYVVRRFYVVGQGAIVSRVLLSLMALGP